MIKPNAELSLQRQSQLLGVSRSSLYYRPRPDSPREADLLKRLDRIFTEHPIYGSRRLRVMLAREGIEVGRRHIRRLMKKLGLWAITPKPDQKYETNNTYSTSLYNHYPTSRYGEGHAAEISACCI
jgi:putative transposase